MYTKIGLVLLFLCVTQSLAVHSGQIINSLRVPFIFFGEGKNGGKAARFSGVILDEKLVLTTKTVEGYTDVKISVGVVDARQPGSQKLSVKSKKCNKDLCIFEVDGEFLFGPIVQRAVLPDKFTEVKDIHLVYIAGYGSDNDNPSKFGRINGLPIHLTSKGVLQARDGTHFKNAGEDDIGAPVWDPYTREVLGFNKGLSADGKNQAASLVKEHRAWIDDERLKWKRS